MVQLSCPDTARWRALLSDSAPAAPELESHLAGCSRCRELLDDLAVGSSGWLRDAGRLATDTDRDPEMTKTLHRLRDALAEDHADPPIPLDFLTPSDQPGILGTLGRYQVLDVIGRGAMGIVLKALDPDLLRPVAVKVLAPYLAPSGTARERFKREARAAAAVSHDHIVTIHAVEEANGLPYLVMEYVTGVSLQGRLDRDGPLPPRDIARIGHQAACGLAAAHEQGLVHRDIKPANILLENGVERVKLTDFGLARAADDARLTQSGVAAGTPLYMSPEQARGEAVDARSDLFSLGSVLYTLATGFPPFRAGSAMGVLHRIINDPPRRIRETIPDFPAELEAIIMQLLEKEPAKRFQLGADVSFRLTAFLAGPHREPPTPAEAGDEAEAEPAPEKTSWWVTALCLLAAAAMVVVVLTFRTPKGTLVVEVDDPEVKVALDGEELTITGAGPQEVRLKPGTYHVTAAAKDGKPAKVSQEVVTITKNGKQTVRVTVEPAPSLPPIVNKTRAVVRDALLAERLRQAFPGADANHLALMRLAGQAALARAETTPLSVDRLPSHKDFPRLEELMGMASWPVIAPDRLHTVLDEAYQLAGTILNDSAAPTAVNPKKSPTQPTNEWEDRLKKLVTEAQAVADRLVKTAPGRVLLTAGPGADPDKVTAGMDKDDAFRAKRLLVLRDEFGRLVPEAQKGIGRWEKARHEVQVRDTKYNAGTIPVTDPEAARIELTDAERSLKAAEDAMTRALADLKKLADEIETAASPEGEFKKVMAEYDAIVLRLAKHPVGRVLTLVGEKWTEGELERRGLEPPDVQRAMKLLKLRDEIKSQAQKVTSAFSARQQNQENLAKHTGPDLDSERWRTNITEDLRLCEQAAKVGTETIRGLLVDLKKLADVLDPPKPTAETLEAEYKKVLAEYDALLLRLVNTRVGRVLALYDKEPNSDKYLKDAGVPDAAVPTAWKLFDLRQKILAQKHDADEHLSRLHMKNNATVPTDEHGLKFRTGALRGLVDDLKKLADELDPPDKKVGPTGKDSGKQ